MNATDALTRARSIFAITVNRNDDAQQTYDAAKVVVKLLAPFVDVDDEEEPIEVPSGLLGQYDDES